MIGRLTGKIKQIDRNPLIIDVGGVGYLVHLPQQQLNKLKPNEAYTLTIHTHVRDDAIELYGFLLPEELELFELLLTVSGIGPKTALNIIDRGASEVKRAVVNGDVAFFTLIPRLGKKNAQKIIIELKTKLGSLAELDLTQNHQETRQIIEALIGMGFKRQEIFGIIKKIPPDLPLKEQVRFCLKFLGKT